ncbi:MAG: adenylate/guanylate cyclase domain-containing protein [Pseudomonadota bacterium]
MRRKLTTILCADGVGYGALMGADEDAAFERLNRRREIMRGLFDRHGGRQINTWGDAVIAEFESVVEAVRCAVEVQEAMEGENAGLPEDRRLAFRIGVNLGDVMVDGEDLYGDGVNVAARLQQAAEPGGVVVSGAVREFAHKQLAFEFDFLGEQKLKNMAEPVPSYAVRLSRRNDPEPMDEAAPPERIRISDGDAFSKTGRRIDALRAWVAAQPRPVRVAAAFIGFFFAVNLLFTGILPPWFVFPSLPFALFIFVYVRRRRRAAASDSAGNPPRSAA